MILRLYFRHQLPSTPTARSNLLLHHLGVIHILRSHQGGEGFGMITLMQFLLYPMPNLITEGGGGLETDKK